MKKRHKLLLMFFFLVIFLTNSSLIYAYHHNHSRSLRRAQILADLELIEMESKAGLATGGPKNQGIKPEISLVDTRAANLQRYLRRHNSPLYEHAELIVSISDEYNLDYRLLVAIAGQESTFGRFIPENSFNAWGWGIYGDQVRRFGSWEEGIRTVAEGLKKNYIDRGLITPGEIMKVYTPSSNGSWANAIRHFFHRIEEPT